MDRLEMMEKVNIALNNCITAKGVRISDFFTADELLDFSNTIVAYMPESEDNQYIKLQEDILDFADKEDFLLTRLKILTSAITINLMFSKSDENTDLFIVTLKNLLITTKLILSNLYKIDLEETEKEMLNFFKSFLLTANELPKNIQSINVPGITLAKSDKSGFVRLTDNRDDYIPTIKTLTNFKHLILKDYGHIIKQLGIN